MQELTPLSAFLMLSFEDAYSILFCTLPSSGDLKKFDKILLTFNPRSLAKKYKRTFRKLVQIHITFAHQKMKTSFSCGRPSSVWYAKSTMQYRGSSFGIAFTKSSYLNIEENFFSSSVTQTSKMQQSIGKT